MSTPVELRCPDCRALWRYSALLLLAAICLFALTPPIERAFAQSGPTCDGQPMPPAPNGENWQCCNGTWYDANVYCCECGDVCDTCNS